MEELMGKKKYIYEVRFLPLEKFLVADDLFSCSKISQWLSIGKTLLLMLLRIQHSLYIPIVFY